ncbi:MAG: class II aldolase/adducin family protein [Actinobacteria bacterium]|nr:class II aldolase/adducin family protein [Actinomycetota bacterium]
MDEKYICFPEDEILKPREIIMDIMQHMIDRNLTDYSGGNMALRVGQRIYSTQTHSADKYRWKLKPDNIIVTDIEKNILEGRVEKLSRELDLHIAILKRFPEINCTLHGNTFYSPLLVSAGVKPVAATEVAEYYRISEIPVVPEGVPNLSDEENNIILSYFEGLKKKGEALVVIMPVHGVIVGASSHDEAFALLEAVENNSKYILFRDLLKTSVLVNSVFSRLADSNGEFNRGVQSSRSIISDSGTVNKEKTNFIDSSSDNKSVYTVKPDTNILTAEDILSITKDSSIKIINVDNGCRITDFAESKAAEIGIKIVRI